jgi:hypothetical protein
VDRQVDGASDSSNLEDFGGFDDPEGFEDFEDFLGIASGTGMLDGKRKVKVSRRKGEEGELQ